MTLVRDAILNQGVFDARRPDFEQLLEVTGECIKIATPAFCYGKVVHVQRIELTHVRFRSNGTYLVPHTQVSFRGRHGEVTMDYRALDAVPEYVLSAPVVWLPEDGPAEFQVLGWMPQTGALYVALCGWTTQEIR